MLFGFAISWIVRGEELFLSMGICEEYLYCRDETCLGVILKGVIFLYDLNPNPINIRFQDGSRHAPRPSYP